MNYRGALPGRKGIALHALENDAATIEAQQALETTAAALELARQGYRAGNVNACCRVGLRARTR
jgi:hypothetical protein